MRDEPICRSAAQPLSVAWYVPPCARRELRSVTARFLRYTFDDRTLFTGIHGWAVELEVFDTSTLSPPNQPPASDAGPDQASPPAPTAAARSAWTAGLRAAPTAINLAFTWTGPFGTASGTAPTVSLPIGTHTVTLTVDDGHGGSTRDTVEVAVVDQRPPEIVSAGPPRACCGRRATGWCRWQWRSSPPTRARRRRCPAGSPG